MQLRALKEKQHDSRTLIPQHISNQDRCIKTLLHEQGSVTILLKCASTSASGSYVSKRVTSYVKEAFENEVAALSVLDPHPNIIHYIGCDAVRHTLYIEYMPGGDLFQAKLYMPYPRLASIIADVASALVYAHLAGVIHRDIKPENILLTLRGTAKLADWGSSLIIGRDLTKKLHGYGTPQFMAPESVLLFEYTPASDVWMLGVTLLECVYNAIPWPEFPSHNASIMIQHFLTKSTPFDAIIRNATRHNASERCALDDFLKLRDFIAS